MKRILSLIVILCLLAGVDSAWAAEKSDQLIIINKATNKLAFYEDGKLLKTLPVATGKKQTYTPEGTFQIVNKIKNRPYYTGKIAGGDPKNPLGDRWMGLNARGTKGDTYGIHGNNNEKSIGSYVSLGCVRMHNKDVRWLFDQVKVGTSVVIANSKLSFADIAKSKNFTVEADPVHPPVQPVITAPLEKVDVRLTLTKDAKLYKKPATEPTPYTLSPQPVQAVEKQADWYRVKTWTGELWLKADQAIMGEIVAVEKKIRMEKVVPILEHPFANSTKKGTLSPQDVVAFEEWNGWYRIHSWVGDVWFDGKTGVTVLEELKVEEAAVEEALVEAPEELVVD
ncbi:L,D-transpeptidase [Ammoniphilus sp. CFH 90114]|uniref:L,D-transpeptidase n=1 Tax=Ammoniphilus sp. CFH 90114 TaxID=2493665 RepID=UPI00100E5D78|nr:L,D-transpeptidase [Ammoniphilus sp. CFH 90114]RXT02873.1 L,D-transpeptidase [Ammoniphilus sp. CFH 90114]